MRHCQKNFAFASLESSLNAISSHFLPACRDEIYTLLWEIGSNALKYGVRDLCAPVQLVQAQSAKSISPSYLAHCAAGVLYILVQESTTRKSAKTLHLCFCYQVPITRFSKSPQARSVKQLSQTLAPRNPHPSKSSPHHNGLGHRLINHYANVFCYNAPKLSIPCAHIRAISLHIKGTYLAFRHGKTQ